MASVRAQRRRVASAGRQARSGSTGRQGIPLQIFELLHGAALKSCQLLAHLLRVVACQGGRQGFRLGLYFCAQQLIRRWVEEVGQGDGIRERWRTCQHALELVRRWLYRLVIILDFILIVCDVAALSLVLHRGRDRSRSSQVRVRMVVLRPTAAAWARVRARHDAGRGSFGGSVGAAKGRARCWRG